jgi:hypothetical protein
MALTKTTGFSSPLGSVLVIQTASTATPDNDVTGGANKTLNVMEVTNGSSATVFVKLYDHAAPTVGTTVPDLIFPISEGATRTLNILGGSSNTGGYTFTTAISMATVGSAGTAGTGSPSGGNVKIVLITT